MASPGIEFAQIRRLFGRVSLRTLLAVSVSLIALAYLAMTVDFHESVRIFRAGLSPKALFGFAIMSGLTIGVFAFRWRLLMGPGLNSKSALVASALCLGGNMVLPARGGDLLRAHYSHKMTGSSYATVLGKLLLEKILDFVTIICIGFLAVTYLVRVPPTEYSHLLSSTLLVGIVLCLLFLIVLAGVRETLISALRYIFSRLGLGALFARHLEPVIRDLATSMSFSKLAMPVIVTIVLWSIVYPPAYLLAGKLVGVTLSYPETLLVLFAGAMGLMIPAAPSGLGTFHASIVSAFVLLGHSAAEGLLFATTVHILFLVAYVTPAAIVLAWRPIKRLIPREAP